MTLQTFYALLNFLRFLAVLSMHQCEVVTNGYAGNGGVVKAYTPVYFGSCLQAFITTIQTGYNLIWITP